MKKIILITAIVLVAGLAVYFLFFTGGENPSENENNEGEQTEVTVYDFDQLETESQPLESYGQVVSTRGIQVVPEISGVVNSVNRSLGQSVSPGDVVVSLRASDQYQQVLQAQASLATAESNLASVMASQPEEVANLQSALDVEQSNLESVRANSVNEIRSTYTTVLGTENNVLDQFFTDGPNPEFSPQSNSQLEENRVVKSWEKFKQTLEEFSGISASVDVDSDMIEALEKSREVVAESIILVQEVSDLVETVRASVSTSQEVIDSWESQLLSEKQKLESKEVSINNSLNRLRLAKESVRVAQNNLNKSSNATLDNEVIVAQNNVASAEAQLSAAENTYSKTQIAAPIFGTISQIDVRVGDLVGPSSPIFVIANDDTLRIDTYISADDIAEVSVGSAVMIDGQYEARVTNIAPALDRQNGKVKVELLLEDQNIRLVEGMGVGVSTERQTEVTGRLLPIGAVFIRQSQPFVYVNQDGVAVAKQIQAKDLFGPEIVVTGGLESGDQVILESRKVKDGEQIQVSENQ